MKENFIHVCFVIDESGSMSGKEADVVGGFKSVIDEQRANSAGTCSVSYFKFADKTDEVYLGKDINEVDYIDGKYTPGGCTALFDAVGIAIDKVGKWLNDMKEEERPEKNLIVVMTDGGENSSREYSASKVKEMIKHQEDKYNWTFVYMGSDLKDANDANTLGFTTRAYASSADYAQNYCMINSVVTHYRSTTGSSLKKSCELNESLKASSLDMTKKYVADNNLSLETFTTEEDTNKAETESEN